MTSIDLRHPPSTHLHVRPLRYPLLSLDSSRGRCHFRNIISKEIGSHLSRWLFSTTHLAAEQRLPLDLNADRISNRSKCCRLRLVDTCLASPHLIIKPTHFAHHSSSRPTRVGAAKAVSLHSLHRLQCPARTSAPRTSLLQREFDDVRLGS